MDTIPNVQQRRRKQWQGVNRKKYLLLQKDVVRRHDRGWDRRRCGICGAGEAGLRGFSGPLRLE